MQVDSPHSDPTEETLPETGLSGVSPPLASTGQPTPGARRDRDSGRTRSSHPDLCRPCLWPSLTCALPTRRGLSWKLLAVPWAATRPHVCLLCGSHCEDLLQGRDRVRPAPWSQQLTQSPAQSRLRKLFSERSSRRKPESK